MCDVARHIARVLLPILFTHRAYKCWARHPNMCRTLVNIINSRETVESMNDNEFKVFCGQTHWVIMHTKTIHRQFDSIQISQWERKKRNTTIRSTHWILIDLETTSDTYCKHNQSTQTHSPRTRAQTTQWYNLNNFKLFGYLLFHSNAIELQQR